MLGLSLTEYCTWLAAATMLGLSLTEYCTWLAAATMPGLCPTITEAPRPTTTVFSQSDATATSFFFFYNLLLMEATERLSWPYL